MNQKGKILGIFNIIDIAILLVVITAIFGFVMKSEILNKVSLSSNDMEIMATFRIEQVTSDNADGYVVGDALLNSETGATLGTITEVKKVGSYTTLRKTDGTVVSALLPRYYDVYITAKGEGTYTELGHFLNGNRHIAPGSTIRVNTFYSQGMSTIVSVESYKTK